MVKTDEKELKNKLIKYLVDFLNAFGSYNDFYNDVTITIDDFSIRKNQTNDKIIFTYLTHKKSKNSIFLSFCLEADEL